MEDEAIRARIESTIPARRLADPEDIAAAATWLAGPDSGYVTGQAIVVDGGLTSLSGVSILQSG